MQLRKNWIVDGIAFVGLLLSPGLLGPVWDANAVALVSGAYAACAYLVARILVLWTHPTAGVSMLRFVRDFLVIFGAAIAPGLIALLLLKIDVSRKLLLIELALMCFFLLVNSLPIIHRRISSVITTLITLSLIGLLVIDYKNEPFFVSNARTSYLHGHGHDVKVTTLELETPHPVAIPTALGGGIDQLNTETLLIANGEGDLYSFSLKSHLTTPLDSKVPIDRTAFLQDRVNGANSQYFRVMDILVNGDRVFASYHHWNGHCTTVRLSEGSLTSSEWILRYETKPCITHEVFSVRAGGRLARAENGDILLTVGDHGYDGLLYEPDLIADPNASYGKIIRLEPQMGWRSSVLTSGHRNPQGLIVTDDAIWATEHGPKGGDELNSIVAGRNYGWPNATYGTEYTSQEWPLAEYPDHTGFTEPIHAWTPSIGISSLIQLNGKEFPAWRNNLLIGSLWGSQSTATRLHRVRVQNGRAVMIESFETGSLVRDLIQLHDGRIAVWTGTNSIQLVEAADVETQSYAQLCVGCHNISTEAPGIGPNLRGLVGRRIASRQGYNYSSAMTRTRGSWTEAKLDAFLRNPKQEIPGNAMIFEGISDDEKRAALIQYLKGLN